MFYIGDCVLVPPDEVTPFAYGGAISEEEIGLFDSFFLKVAMEKQEFECVYKEGCLFFG
jgi:hypothetical protein